ncbi:MAG: ribosomal protection-like ABC-F family protein, partial [Bacillota bacterium]
MTILSCQQIKKYHGANLILEDVTFELGEGERAGLIGRNGCGKSTLLQIVAGLQQPDGGQLSIRKRSRIGYLPQIPAEREGMTVYDLLAQGYQEVLASRERMRALEVQMARQEPPPTQRQMTAWLEQYAEEQERFQREGGYEMEAQILQVAHGLGIPPEQFGRPYTSLSGGEQTKVALASLLIERPTLLLLDEPTNHLDTESIEWLEGFLSTYTGTCLIVSHDRYFLDRVVTRVIELEDGEAALYSTNYSGYVKEKEERLLQQFEAYQEQQKRIRQMRETIRQLQEWGRIGDNGKFFRRAASMQKALDRMERVKRPNLERTTEFDLRPSDRSGQEVLTIAGLSKRYGERPLLSRAEGALTYGEKVVLVGRNGAGKSTLFRLLLGEEQPDEGSVRLGARVAIGYLAQQERPQGDKSLLQAFREEAGVEEGEARSRLARYLFFGSDVFKPLSALSGGEWTRFRLALLIHRMPNLLLLDEPTNHLDIPSREALEEALEEYPGTLLAISHDRYFINRLAQRVWELEEGRLTSYLGNYDAYREKREQLREPAPEPAEPKRQTAAPERRRRPDPGREARARIEEQIAAVEQRLAALEAELEQAQATADLDALTARWAEREALEGERDQL